MKTYIKPEMEIVVSEGITLLAGSIALSSEDTDIISDNASQLAPELSLPDNDFDFLNN